MNIREKKEWLEKHGTLDIRQKEERARSIWVSKGGTIMLSWKTRDEWVIADLFKRVTGVLYDMANRNDTT